MIIFNFLVLIFLTFCFTTAIFPISVGSHAYPLNLWLFFLTLRTIWVHRLWLPLQFVKWLLWLWYWILLHSNPGCEVRNVTGPTLSMRKWSSGTGLRPPSWNKSSTTGPAGQVDNTAAFDLYFNSSLYILTFWSVI